tara:strand:- start:1291 stop:1731 length:441 start_codon:yes stop_codon:yes gene_type:complete
MIRNFSQDDLKVKKLIQNVISHELEAISKLDPEEKERKNQDLRGLIEHYFTLNNAIEEKCYRICNFSLQFLILCLIATGALLLQRDKIGLIVFTLVLSFLAIQVLFLLLIAITHESESQIKDSFYAAKEDDSSSWFYFKGRSIFSS